MCNITDPIGVVAKKLRNNNISGIPVMEGGKLMGIITEGDILRLLRTPKIFQRTLAAKSVRAHRGAHT